MARHNEISSVDIKKLEGVTPVNGERLNLPSKELDVCEIYPQVTHYSTTTSTLQRGHTATRQQGHRGHTATRKHGRPAARPPATLLYC